VDTFLAIASRREVREYAGRPIPADAEQRILEAGRIAGSSQNSQPWRFLVVESPSLRERVVLVPQAFVTQWWQLAILRGLMGMTLAGLLPSIAKEVRHAVSDHNSGKTLGYLQSAQFSGQVIGPLIGGQIGAHFSLRAVFFVTASLLLVCAGLNRWARAKPVR